jgi:hypothetical protein
MHLGRANDDLRIDGEGSLVEHGNQLFGLRDGTIALPVTTNKELAGFGASRRMVRAVEETILRLD